MKRHEQSALPHLFVLRAWEEELGQGRAEWRGKIQHATSGETRYFRDWSALGHLLLNMLAEQSSPPSASESPVDETRRTPPVSDEG